MNDVNIKLAALMVELYNWSPETFKEILVTGKAQRKIMLNLYQILTKEGEIIPIEVLQAPDRQKIWDEAYLLIKGRLSKSGCIDVTKALYTLKAISK
jgi:hypothetical protein